MFPSIFKIKRCCCLRCLQTYVCDIMSCFFCSPNTIGLPCWLSGKEFACQCRRPGLNPWIWKIPWRRKWQLTPVFLPGKFHGQRSLVGYSPWGSKRVRYNLVTQQQQQYTLLYYVIIICDYY